MVNWQRGVERLRRDTNHEVVVTRVEDFGDRYRRIHFTGDDLLRELIDVYPTAWVRLRVPRNGNPAGALTGVGDRSGTEGTAGGPGRFTHREYTFVDVDIHAGSFALDFVLRTSGRHGGPGPATRWAMNAAPGTTIDASVTPERIDLPGDTRRLVLLGDLSALPAVNSWLGWIPGEVEVTVILEDDGDREGIPQRQRTNATWTWVNRTDVPGQAIVDEVRGLGLDTNGLYVWAAGERGLISTVRSRLRHELPLDKKRRFSQFYWSAGRSAA